MITVEQIKDAKLTTDTQVTGTQRLWLNGVVIAAPSWHVDVDGLITAPQIDDDYRDDWLVDVCGGLYPDFSPAVKNILLGILNEYEGDLIAFFDADPVDRDKTLLSRMETAIREAAAAKLQSA